MCPEPQTGETVGSRIRLSTSPPKQTHQETPLSSEDDLCEAWGWLGPAARFGEPQSARYERILVIS